MARETPRLTEKSWRKHETIFIHLRFIYWNAKAAFNALALVSVRAGFMVIVAIQKAKESRNKGPWF